MNPIPRTGAEPPGPSPLTADQRTVLVLVDSAGLAPEEVATALRLPSSVVRARLSGARRALRTRSAGRILGAHVSGGPLVVRPTGELDAHTAPGLRRRLAEVLDASGDVVVDLGAVPLLGAAGGRVLLDAQRRGAGRGATVRVVGTRPGVARVLRLLGVPSVPSPGPPSRVPPAPPSRPPAGSATHAPRHRPLPVPL